MCLHCGARNSGFRLGSYDVDLDVYRCPAGETLTFRFEDMQKGRMMRHYEVPSLVCRNCELKTQCTDAARGRRIRRWEDESLLEEMRDRVKATPQRMKQRKEIVERTALEEGFPP